MNPNKEYRLLAAKIIGLDLAQKIYEYLTNLTVSRYFYPMTIRGQETYIHGDMMPVEIGIVTNNCPNTVRTSVKRTTELNRGKVKVRIEMEFDMCKSDARAASAEITSLLDASEYTEVEIGEEVSAEEVSTTEELRDRMLKLGE